MAESSLSSLFEIPSVVVDLGTRNIRAGFSEEFDPRSIFPNMIGVPKKEKQKPVKDTDTFVGNEAQKRRVVLSLGYPVQRGIVTDWDAMETVINHMYLRELKVDPEKHSVLMIEAPLNPASNMERMAQLMFETFETTAFHMTLSPLAALAALGESLGVVLCCGEGVTSVYVVYDGFVMPHAVKRIELAGVDLTFNLSQLLSERGYSFATASSLEIVREMKETLCYCATDYEEELTRTVMTSAIEEKYELPDGQIITVGKERFQCPEALFNPSLIGSDSPGLADLVFDCVRDIDIKLRKKLFKNVILEGGTTTLPGFLARLNRDLSALVPPSGRVVIRTTPERLCTAWYGGSVAASMGVFQHLWVTRSEYEENGPNILHRKCPGIG